VFNWRGIRFTYDWVPIANQYELDLVADLTDLPFWQEMGYSEWRVMEPRVQRGYSKRYEGKKDKDHRRLFWT
jgi:hypothetical protein